MTGEIDELDTDDIMIFDNDFYNRLFNQEVIDDTLPEGVL